MRNRGKFETASQFLACYFHQDFSIEFEEPEAAVAQFIKDNDEARRAAVVRELRQVITECGKQGLDDFIFELGCYYNPERHRGILMRAWLEQVIAEIERSLSQ
jgi:hypothetical protein